MSRRSTPSSPKPLREAGIGFGDLGGIAVANRPGLLGALLVGVSAAKTLAYALRVPLLGVHHIEAHIYANWLVEPDIAFPVVCLVASGGHSEIFLVRGHGDYQILGPDAGRCGRRGVR